MKIVYLYTENYKWYLENFLKHLIKGRIYHAHDWKTKSCLAVDSC